MRIAYQFAVYGVLFLCSALMGSDPLRADTFQVVSGPARTPTGQTITTEETRTFFSAFIANGNPTKGEYETSAQFQSRLTGWDSDKMVYFVVGPPVDWFDPIGSTTERALANHPATSANLPPPL
jgi:hypothetical protein